MARDRDSLTSCLTNLSVANFFLAAVSGVVAYGTTNEYLHHNDDMDPAKVEMIKWVAIGAGIFAVLNIISGITALCCCISKLSDSRYTTFSQSANKSNDYVTVEVGAPVPKSAVGSEIYLAPIGSRPASDANGDATPAMSYRQLA